MNGFALWVGIGAALGLWRVARGVSDQQAKVWLNMGLVVLLLALTGARLFYVGLHWSYFSRHALEIPKVWLGGLSWPGAAAGAWLGLVILAASCRSPRGERIPLGLLSDRLYPLLPPLAITAWLGSWQIGSAYGGPLPPGTWWAAPSLDASGFYNPHWPLQPAAALALLAFFALLERIVRPDHPRGLLATLAAVGLLLSQLAAALLRGDPLPRTAGVPLDAWIALVYLAFFLLFLLFHNLAARLWRKQNSLQKTGSL